MDKVIILGDLHLGAHKNSNSFLEYQKKFFIDILFPYIKNNGIKKVFQLGDVLDQRQKIDFVIGTFLRGTLFKWFEDNQVQLNILLGNHDIYWRENLDISGLNLMVGTEKYIRIYNDLIYFKDEDFLLVPWVCKENKEKIVKFLEKIESKRTVILGHLELANFLVNTGYVAKSGTLDPKLFKDNLVFSGHYHSPSSKGNIHYVGTPYQLTWSDVDDNKFFVEFDTKNRTYERILTNHRIYYKIRYEKLNEYDFSSMEKPFIKLYVDTDKVKEKDLTKTLGEIELSCNPQSLQVIDISKTKEVEIEEPEETAFKSPIEILIEYIEESEVENKNKVLEYTNLLYKKSLEEA